MLGRHVEPAVRFVGWAPARGACIASKGRSAEQSGGGRGAQVGQPWKASAATAQLVPCRNLNCPGRGQTQPPLSLLLLNPAGCVLERFRGNGRLLIALSAASS